jgi:hypothetical protein
LKYPIAGDVIDVCEARVTQADGLVVEVSAASQIHYATPAPTEIDFGGCTPIGEIGDVGNYSSRGRVVARSSNQFILQDETGAILVYSNYAADLEVGKC